MSDTDRFAASLPVMRLPELPPLGGEFKASPEDFLVEEIPAYPPCGEGEHLFLWVEKRDCSAEFLTRRLAKAFGAPPRDLGVAGMKDRAAVTRQYVSIPAKYEDRLEQFDDDLITIVSATRHTNKLKTGHLRGNRFRLWVRGVHATASDTLQQLIPQIQQHGFPNYFGTQRFGRDLETLQLGFDLLEGKKTPRDIPASRRRFLLRLALSAAQSHLFNCFVGERIAQHTLNQVIEGDVMQVVESGGLFLAEDVDAEQPRCDRGETTVTGPMFGPKMKQSAPPAADAELRLLGDFGLTIDHFAQFSKIAAGTRRPVVIRPGNLSVEEHGPDVCFEFTLPSGVYATSLLREFMEV